MHHRDECEIPHQQLLGLENLVSQKHTKNIQNHAETILTKT